MNGNYVFVDVETTGARADRERVTEVAALRVEDGQIVKVVHTLLNPDKPIPYQITQLTGITNDMVADQRRFDDIADELLELFDNATMVAHHVRFDYSFLKAEFKRSGMQFRPTQLCTVKLSRYLYPHQGRHRLSDVIAAHSFSFTSRHRAYDDAYVLWQFWQKIHDDFDSERLLSAFSTQHHRPSIPAYVDRDHVDALPHAPGIYVFENEKGYPLYIGKSIDIKKRVMSHFTRDTEEYKEFKISSAVRSIRCEQTVGELSALLLESKRIKEYLPLYNRRLRRKNTLMVSVSEPNEGGYIAVSQKEFLMDKLPAPEAILAVHVRRGMAKQTLLKLIKTFDLCPKLCGVEKGKGPCFSYQLGKCRGACIGKEPASTYNKRLKVAFEHRGVESWPYSGPILVVEGKPGSHQQGFIVHNWVITDTVELTDSGEAMKSPYMEVFDYDAYQIVESYLRRSSSNMKIVPYNGEFDE